MTTLAPPPVRTGDVARPAPLGRAVRFELVKLLAQWRVRLLLLTCWVAPALFVAVVSRQSSLPADTVFGRWMDRSGAAGPLVVLMFCGAWVLPLATSLVAGDVFAAEDRLGTWRHLLVTVRSPRRIFAAKTAAALTVVLVLWLGLAVSGVVGGLLAVGGHDLVGLDGHLLSAGSALTHVVLAWLCVVPPTLAFAAVGLLGSVVLGRSPMGLATPALLAVVLQLAQLLPLPAVVRAALPSWAFLSWRGLFTEPAQPAGVVVGLVVSAAWLLVAAGVAYALFLRRDFTDLAHDGLGRRAAAVALAPLAGLLLLGVAGVAVATPASGSGVTRAALDRSLATTFAHLYRLQARELNRPDVTETQLAASAACDKGGSLVADSGPGNDWRCVVQWHIPGARAVGRAIYQLDVTPDGRYIADGDGPKSVNGYFPVRTSTGDAANPLWQFDGLVDLLDSPTVKD
ncbi:ABC transporter permease [Jatrophihabitans fulvus]